jgi:hypothetical protein
MENDESFGKVKLSVLLESKCGYKYSVFPYNKKLCVTVIGLELEEQADCPLPSARDVCQRTKLGQEQEMDGLEEKCSSRSRDKFDATESN